MLRFILIAGGLAVLVSVVDFTVSPETRAKLLRAGRTVAGVIHKNSKVTDEYMRCLELEPTQQNYCKQRFEKQAKEANGINVQVKVDRVGGTVVKK